MNAKLTLGQAVDTPNGRGIYQFPLYSEGQVLAMVSHNPIDENPDKPKPQIDLSKCRCYSGCPGGMWQLAGYDPDEVKPV